MSCPHLVLRADGGADIGWGHVARCFALAQAWLDAGGTVTFASRSMPSMWAARCADEGIAVQEPHAVDCGAAAWVVFDGYHLNADEWAFTAGSGARTLVVDDHGLSDYGRADAILDQNLGATSASYASRHDRTTLLLGVEYALIRREFRERRTVDRTHGGDAQTLLVSLGGSASEAGARIAQAVTADPRLAGLDVRHLAGVSDAASEMAIADLALAASGSTCWELCCMGVPSVLLALAENQVPLGHELARAGAAVDAGPSWTVDPERVAVEVGRLRVDAHARSRMSRRGQALVDGRGAERVVALLRTECTDGQSHI